MGRKLIDLTGRRFGRLVVIERAENDKRGGKVRWACLCDCGTERIVRGALLRNGESQSCGCLHAEKNRDQLTTHGMRSTTTYQSWAGMKGRCLNPNHSDYKNYGGRGIRVCDRWLDFSKFYADMKDRPEGLSLERINNNGDYEPLNVCWATKEQQMQNNRNAKLTPKKVRKIRFLGKTKTLRQIAKMFGVGSTAIYKVLQARTLREGLGDELYDWCEAFDQDEDVLDDDRLTKNSDK